MSNAIEKIVIIGSGAAGSTAAIYTARAGLEPLVLHGTQPGGQLTTTTEVENFPGFVDGIQGPDMMMAFQKQAERFGARYVSAEVTRVDLSARPFAIETDDGNFRSAAMIVASGASPKLLGFPDEKRFFAQGYHTCATCDGAFYRGREVVIIGGGDSAMEEGTFLTRLASKVTVVHRRDQLRASKIMQDRALANPKMTFAWNSVVEGIRGEPGKVTGVAVRDVDSGEVREIAAQGVFIAIGHTPNTKLFEGQLELDDKGYLVAQGRTSHTSVEGVFVAGDCADSRYRQAVTAAGSGCMAAIDAERWLESQ